MDEDEESAQIEMHQLKRNSQAVEEAEERSGNRSRRRWQTLTGVKGAPSVLG